MSLNRESAAFGSWESPITAELLSNKPLKIEEPESGGSFDKIFYIERRPHEQGRCCIVQYENGCSRDVLPARYSARTTVHEYGATALKCGADGKLIFSDHKTNGIFSLDPISGDVAPVSLSISDVRYGDFDIHPKTPNWILAIREDQRSVEVQNTLVVIDSNNKIERVIAIGRDFYSHPRFSADGKYICYMCWDNPAMQWTRSSLIIDQWAPEVESRVFPRVLAGCSALESVSQPRWGPDGTLFFASDRTGFYQLYRIDSKTLEITHIRLAGLEDAEFAAPEWYLGSTTYVPLTSTSIVAATVKTATALVIVIDIYTNTFADLKLPLVSVNNKAMSRVSNTEFVLVGSTLITGSTMYLIDVLHPNLDNVIRSSMNSDIAPTFYSTPRHIFYPLARDGGVGNTFFFPPQNPNFHGPKDEAPPLILVIHGGPTLHASPGFSPAIQYWTSRGYAVATCNPRGSSGYGRAYRDQLNGRWGVDDISDIKDCAIHLSSQKLVDPARLGIVGRSSGGYAVLRALCEYPSVWAAGICFYGIGNLENLLQRMHKFEAYYVRELLFKTGATKAEIRTMCQSRSPSLAAANISAPLLLFHSADDPVVPISQAEGMAHVIKEHGGVVELLRLAREGHGIRRVSNILKVRRKEEIWWAEHLAKR